MWTTGWGDSGYLPDPAKVLRRASAQRCARHRRSRRRTTRRPGRLVQVDRDGFLPRKQIGRLLKPLRLGGTAGAFTSWNEAAVTRPPRIPYPPRGMPPQQLASAAKRPRAGLGP